MALVVTKKTKGGRWTGGGPVQWISSSYSSEQEILELTYNEYKDAAPVFMQKIGEWNVYSLGRSLESDETDVRKRLNKEYDINIEVDLGDKTLNDLMNVEVDLSGTKWDKGKRPSEDVIEKKSGSSMQEILNDFRD